MANLDRFFADFYGNGGWRLEAFSKVASQDHDAGELDEGEEICGMVLIADNHAPEVLEPGVHALDLPASFVAPQRQPVLGFAERFAVGRDEDPAARGTWQTDPHHGGTRYLWAGYRYQPPQMGFWVDPPGAAGLGVYGAATGPNKLGQYYCWNRLYDVNLGRWTTPDPVATPFFNRQAYGFAPVRTIDPSGLQDEDGLHSHDFEDWVKDNLKKAQEDVDDKLKLFFRAQHGNWCGPGGKGKPLNAVDECCKAHDECFEKAGIDAGKYIAGAITAEQAVAAKLCNDKIIECVKNAMENGNLPEDAFVYAKLVVKWFTYRDSLYEPLRKKGEEAIARRKAEEELEKERARELEKQRERTPWHRWNNDGCKAAPWFDPEKWNPAGPPGGNWHYKTCVEECIRIAPVPYTNEYKRSSCEKACEGKKDK